MKLGVSSAFQNGILMNDVLIMTCYPDQRCFDHDDIDAGGDVCHAFHDELDDRGGGTDLSLLLMMYFSAAVNSPASFGSIVTRSSICTLFPLDAFFFALAC